MAEYSDKKYSEMFSERRLENVFNDLGKLNYRDRALVLSFAVELQRILFLHHTGQKIDLVWSEHDSRVAELFDQRQELTPDETHCVLFCLYLLDHVNDFLAERNV